MLIEFPNEPGKHHSFCRGGRNRNFHPSKARDLDIRTIVALGRKADTSARFKTSERVAMFEPFGQLMGLLPPEKHGGEHFASRRMYRVAIVGFWVLVSLIVVARIVLASRGGLFAFGS